MNTRTPKFWALIGFGVGAVIAAGGSIAGPLDSLFGGLIQAGIWFGVSSLILRKKSSQSVRTSNIASSSPSLKNTFHLGDYVNSGQRKFKQCASCKAKMTVDWGHCKNCLGNKFIEITEEEMLAVSDLTSSNFCKYCKQEIPAESQQCPNCFPEQTYTKEFSHRICMYCKKKYSATLKQCPSCFPGPITRTSTPAKPSKKQLRQSPPISSEEAMGEAFNASNAETGVVPNPEFKTCPMCAEDIKFAAKKCRYCQHMLDA